MLFEPRIDEVLDLLAVEFALPLNDDELEVLEPVARVQFVLKGINLFSVSSVPTRSTVRTWSFTV